MINDEVNKSWYLSKTLWINILAIATLIVQAELGWNISPEQSLIILGGINALLRIISKKELTW